MVLRFYKSNLNHIVIFLFVFGIILWIPGFFAEQKVVFNIAQNPLLDFLSPIYQVQAIEVFIAFLLLMLQAIMLNNIIAAFDIIVHRTYIPALVYITLMSIHPQMLQLHPVLITNLLLLFLINTIFKLYDNDANYQFSYTLGFVIAIASLVYSYNIVFSMVVFSSYIVYRIFNWRIWMTTLIGIVTPFLLLFTVFFLADSIDFFNLYILGQIEFFKINPSAFPIENIYIKVLLISALILLLIRYYLYSGDKIIRIRNYSAIIIWLFFFSFLTILLNNDHPFVHSAIIFISLSILFSVFLLNIKKHLIAEIFFSIILGILVWFHISS